MKASAPAVVALAIGVSAQSLSTVFEYYDDCSTFTGAMSTSTDSVVQTFCPECTGTGGVPATATRGGATTTYITVYPQLCPTGLVGKTYTITEPCPTLGVPREASHLPQGFAVTTATCTACEGKPLVTLTVPVMVVPTAAQGVPAAGTPAATAGSSPPAGGSSPNAPAPAAPKVVGAAPAAGSPAAAVAGGSSPAASSPGAAVPAASAVGGTSPAAPAAVAPAAAAAPPAAAAAPPAVAPASGAAAPFPIAGATQARGQAAPSASASNNRTGPVVPFTGSASRSSIGMSVILVLAGVMGGFFAIS